VELSPAETEILIHNIKVLMGRKNPIIVVHPKISNVKSQRTLNHVKF
jgi:hypothetical protein